MKAITAITVALVLLLVPGLFAAPARADVSIDFFYSNLSPYGTWHVSAQYGDVWQPSGYGPGWNPYYDGQWVYSDLGWTWVSDYRWGAIPYHYGTWALDPRFGWVWVPGYVWAPSWVVFRTGPDYIGWAPISPHFSIGAWFSSGEPSRDCFVFVPSARFAGSRIRGHVVSRDRRDVLISRTKVVNRISIRNDVVVNHGPDLSLVERASGRKIRQVPIERVSRAAPGPRVSRAGIKVDPERSRKGVRVTEPSRGKGRRPSERPGATGQRREAEPRSLAARERPGDARRGDVSRRPTRRQDRPDVGPASASRRPSDSTAKIRRALPRRQGQDRTVAPSRNTGKRAPARTEPDRRRSPRKKPRPNQSPGGRPS